MSGRGSKRLAARLLCAVATGVFAAAAPVHAQSNDEVDPAAPLDPLPGLEVEWPDLETADPAPEPQPSVPVAAEPSSGPSLVAEEVSERRYTVVVEGLATVADAADIIEVFRKQSALEQNDGEPANVAQIDRRSRADAELLAELLRARGYYDATVEARAQSTAEALAITIVADPGQQYRFAEVSFPGLEAAGGEEARALIEGFGIKAGDPVIAEEVIAGELALRTALGEQGYAEARIGERDIEINHQTRLATLTLPVDPGPIARFGQITVTGKPPFSPRHVGTIARFKRGDPYKRSKVDDLRRALIATGLVSTAEVQVVPVDGGRTVDLAVKLDPAPARTIAGELGYGTGEGARIEGSWQHRNFFNPEGALTLRGVLGTNEQLAGVALRRNNFLRRDQVLNLQVNGSHREFEAYEASTLLLAGNIERQSNFIWQKTWTWTGGAEFLATDERGVFAESGVKDTKTFLIAAAPASLGYDGSDSLLDPTTGFRLLGRVSPEVSFQGGGFTYVRAQLDASAYRPISDNVVAAGRIRLGTIGGAGLFDLAPSRRFYSGGGGSVRGYGYQRLGPKDLEDDPIGGRGLAEFAIEARIRLKQFGGNLGIVPFFDGGTLSADSFPDLSDWRFAAGLGARYYSSFGPIRLDVGVPLNRRSGDGPVAVTVSLGQAF